MAAAVPACHATRPRRVLGSVPNHDLPRYLQRARVFVLPSHYEGHPKALLEAMACGLPVIGSDVPGIRELLHHGETGYLCPPSPDGIRTAVELLLGDAALRHRLGQQARQYVLDHFALNRIVELELAMLHAVAAGRSQP
ncbi:MAG: glycosyltransferase family 4 protein [Chloroflexaceae bacterium]|nr:glycosyltransferase family 4 protein [Chloroflexaceae bacterium]